MFFERLCSLGLNRLRKVEFRISAEDFTQPHSQVQMALVDAEKLKLTEPLSSWNGCEFHWGCRSAGVFGSRLGPLGLDHPTAKQHCCSRQQWPAAGLPPPEASQRALNFLKPCGIDLQIYTCQVQSWGCASLRDLARMLRSILRAPSGEAWFCQIRPGLWVHAGTLAHGAQPGTVLS